MKMPAFVQDAWVQASWDQFLSLANDPALDRAKFYYNRGWMRIEMSPVGPSHAQDNGLLASIVAQWLVIRGLPLCSYVNATLRKADLQEAQPDLAYFAGEADVRPARSNRPIDLAAVAPPVLIVEISATTLEDDLTAKHELYAALAVGEYWVVDVEAVRVLAGLEATVLAEALRRGQSEGDAAAMRYIGKKGYPRFQKDNRSVEYETCGWKLS
jgi:Uma2 family endonuclease